MRKCHLNTCPVGIATQNETLRRKFIGTPENVINYFFLVAEDVREIMASLGISKFDDLIGRSDLLVKQEAIEHWKAKDIDLSKILWSPKIQSQNESFNSSSQQHDLQKVADKKIIKDVKEVIEGKKSSIKISKLIKNTDRSFGAMLSGVIAQKFGFKGLNDDSIIINLKGTAGQSFGTFLSRGVTLILDGEANDYVGKGLSGGRIVIKPFSKSKIKSNENMIVGNTVLYGAIAGECFLSGVAGERFAVRNSGAIAVIEGTGDHCCEYMTGGVVMVLGETGVNFAAGMSGGIAYVYDKTGDFIEKCNTSMVEIIKPTSMNSHSHVNLFNRNTYLENDEKRIREMLIRHINYTNSSVAKEIIENFNEEIKSFIKVLPLDFKAALKKVKINEEKEKDRPWQK